MQLSPILQVKSTPRMLAVMGSHKSRSQGMAREGGFLMEALCVRRLRGRVSGTRWKEQECSGEQCQVCWAGSVGCRGRES